MTQYYYTAAALPMLTFDGDAPLRIDQFIEFCAETTGTDDAHALLRISQTDLTEIYPQPSAERWRLWEIALRNALVDHRAEILGWGEEFRRSDVRSFEAESIVGSAAATDTPLEAEIVLDEARWGFANELEQGHYFDIVFLISYCVKLTILERRAGFTLELGREAYERIYETTLESL